VIYKYLDKTIAYEGSQIRSLWAFRNFGLQGDSIISFRGPCRVELPDMVDIEDVREKSAIFSTDMLHFIVEHFDLDLEKTIIRQRLLIALIKDIISHRVSVKLVRLGDDLYLENRKLSVSIATLTPVSTKIHTGLNVSSRETPVPAVGLLDLGFDDTEVRKIGEEVSKKYAEEYEDIKLARCKVRGVG